MRISIVSNLYPPHSVGGYEIGCKDIVHLLSGYGHSVSILTSRFGKNKSEFDGIVFRLLYSRHTGEGLLEKLLAPFFEVANRKIFADFLNNTRPDLVYFWNLSGISYWFVKETSRRKIKSACFVSDHWLALAPKGDYLLSRISQSPTYWLGTLYRFYIYALIRILRLDFTWSPLDIDRIQAVSLFISDQVKKQAPGCTVEIIHWGVSPLYFNQQPRKISGPSDTVLIIYAGQIVPHKGVLTAVKAMNHLLRSGRTNFHFLIAGSDPIGFSKTVEEEIVKHNLQNFITFLGMLPRDQLRQHFLNSEIYIFPSEWDEPFAISPLEAMACGCAVISTNTGGSAELFKHEINSLIFEKSNYIECAECIIRLLDDQSLREFLGKNARSQVCKSFSLAIMARRIEKSLSSLVSPAL